MLRAARLFDGSVVVDQPSIVVEHGRIVVVERRRFDPPSDAEVADFGDATLLPGLIDTHVHLGFDAGPDPVGRFIADDDAVLLLRMRLAARRALAAGVTTVRDLGDRAYLALALREWFRQGNEIGPDVVASGPPLTVTGGHCHFMSGEADDEAELRRGVRERAKRGVDIIKVMATGGNMTAGISPLSPQYTSNQLATVVEEAHRFGRPVTAHAHGLAGIESAVEAGVDGLEHCGFWVAEGVRAEQSLIDRMVERHISVCPTLGIVPGTTPPPPAMASRLPAVIAAVARMYESGVRLLAGTDAGVSPAKPHGATPYAVRDLVEQCGLPTVEALKAATSSAAAACGMAGRKGVLAAGADADVLAVGGNALADVRCLHDVRAVFRAGVRLERGDERAQASDVSPERLASIVVDAVSRGPAPVLGGVGMEVRP